MSNLQLLIGYMAKQNVIIIESGDHIEGYTSLLNMSKMHPEFSYEYLLKKATFYPFKYKGWKFYKVGLNERHFYAKKL